MKIILATVMSLDGKTTYGKDVGVSWSSAEDKAYFQALRDRSRLVILGSTTYQIAKPHMKLSPRVRRMVMTHEPEKYLIEKVDGQLEFTNETPAKLTRRLTDEGYEEALLASGETLSAHFLKENLVNELWITIEPLLFGSGKGITTELPSAVKLELMSSEKLNEQGTLLLKYKII